jgi:nucleoside-diphosphate-sugar epimerase
MKKKIFIITGYTGFIGSNFIKQSKTINKFDDVFFISRNLIFTKKQKKNSSNHKWDYLSKEIINKNVVVLHLATKYTKLTAPYDHEEIFESNVKFGLNLLNALRSAKKVEFLNIASCFQNKKLSNYPDYIYTRTKNTFIYACSCYALLRKFNFKHIYVYDTFGEDDVRNKLLPQLIASCNSNKTFVVSNTEQKLFLTEISEVISGLDYCIKNFSKIQDSSSIHQNSSIKISTLIKLADSIKPLKISIRKNKSDLILFKKSALPEGWQPNLTVQESLKELFKKCIK